MLIKYLFVIPISFLLGMVFIGLFRRLVLRHKVLILQGVPLIGGISIGLTFLLTYFFIYFLYKDLLQGTAGIFIASSTMLAFGIIDDWRELSVTAKLLIQIVVTSLLILFGVKTQIVYIGNLLNIIITFLWVLGITNAFNHLDVLDGLAGGIAMIISLTFFVISLLNGQINTIILTSVLSGAILSFLLYNWPPAKIYMGNAGSHFLGFVLAAVALAISYAPLERRIALLSPLLILGFPIFDTSFVILIRICKRKLPFKKSRDHLALRFLALGYSKKKTLLIMLGWGLFFSLSGVILSQVSNTFGIIIVTFVVLVSLLLFKKMSRIAIDE